MKKEREKRNAKALALQIGRWTNRAILLFGCALWIYNYVAGEMGFFEAFWFTLTKVDTLWILLLEFIFKMYIFPFLPTITMIYALAMATPFYGLYLTETGKKNKKTTDDISS